MLHNFVSAARELYVNHAAHLAFACGAFFACREGMQAKQRPTPATLRAEARLLSLAGWILLAIAFPATLALTAHALMTEGASPFLPAAIGAPPLMLGYLACHFASERMVKAKAVEAARPRRRRYVR